MKKVILIAFLVMLTAGKCEAEMQQTCCEEYDEMIKYSDWADVDGDSTLWTATATNDSVLGAKDGTGWRKEIPGEWFGFIQAIMKAANVQPNDVLDTADASQILDALRSLDVPLSRLSEGFMDIEYSDATHDFVTQLNGEGFNQLTLSKTDKVTPEQWAVYIANNLMSTWYNNAAGELIKTEVAPRGIKFDGSGSPGEDVASRDSTFLVTPSALTTDGFGRSVIAIDKELTGIPNGTNIHRVSYTAHLSSFTGTVNHVISGETFFDTAGSNGYLLLEELRAFTTLTLGGLAYLAITVSYDPTNL